RMPVRVDGEHGEGVQRLGAAWAPGVPEGGHGEWLPVTAGDPPAHRLAGFVVRLEEGCHRNQRELPALPRTAISRPRVRRLRAGVVGPAELLAVLREVGDEAEHGEVPLQVTDQDRALVAGPELSLVGEG